MTDTYTEQEIRKAAARAGAYDGHCERLIAELQHPAWEPAEGELYLYRTTTGGIDIWEHTEGDDIRPGATPQSLAMHGPAVKALRDALVYQFKYGTLTQRAKEDLAAFDEVVR